MDGIGKVVAGVDTHKDEHVLCVLDGLGRKVLTGTFAASAEGYDELARAVGGPEGCEVIGVEGTASYGSGLTKRLFELGYDVVEVLRPKGERRRPGEDKSDAADAERAARIAAAGKGVPPKSQDGWVERVRALDVARDVLVRSATAAVNCARGLLVTAPEGMRAELSGAGKDALMAALAVETPAAGPIEGSLREALRALALSYAEATARAASLEEAMESLIRENAPALLGMRGCGAICAAKLAAAAGDNPGRLPGEASFARLCGASPVEASSGKTTRHRLNLGGNRQANRALTVIVNSRLRTDARTKEYFARRTAEGKTKKEIKRCLKRYVAREAYHALMRPAPEAAAPGGGELRRRRVELGLTQAQAASMLLVSQSKVSNLERGVSCSPEIARSYAEALEKLAKRA